VLHSLLGSFTSRYTQADGYWAFGVLFDQLTQLNTSLIGDQRHSNRDLAAIISRARRIFADQLQKHGVPYGNVIAADIALTQPSPDSLGGYINGHAVTGAMFLVSATATMRAGKFYACQQQLFVAPHDPTLELHTGPSCGITPVD